jgi:hypothetical protein
MSFDHDQVYAQLGYGRKAWFRFVNTDIPKGSTILSAIITFSAYQSNAETTCNIKITANDVDYSEWPVDATAVDALVHTTAYTEWSNVEAFVSGTSYSTPDFKSVIQEVIDREEWAPGNPITVLLFDNTSVGATAIRAVDSVDNTLPTHRPVLTITYIAETDDRTGTSAFSLPSLTFTSSAVSTSVNALLFPALTISAVGTIGFAVDVTLPSILLSAHGELAPVGTLAANLPKLSVAAVSGLHIAGVIILPLISVSSRAGESAALILPALTATGTSLVGVFANGDVTIPVPTLTTAAYSGEIGDASCTLAALTATGEAFDVPVGTLAASLAAMRLRGTAYGSDRFASTILRYSRP